MKRIVLFLLFAILSSAAVSAQTSCAVKHRIFRVPTKKTPAVIKKLGSSPQFVPLRHIASHATMYKAVRNLNKQARYKKEINALFRAAGYTGVTDREFVPANIIKTTLPFGTIGMLGDGNHSYVYSILTLTGIKNIKCWKIVPINGGCSFYIMSECGNAFCRISSPGAGGQKVVTVHEPAVQPAVVEQAPPPPPAPTVVQAPPVQTDLTLNVYARYRYNACNCCNPKAIYNKPVYKNEESLIGQKHFDNVNNVTDANAEKQAVTKDVYVDVDKATYKKMKKHHKKEMKEAEKRKEKMAEKKVSHPGTSRSAQ